MQTINMTLPMSVNQRYAFFLFIIAVLVYLPGLPGEFIYDDYFNILQNPAINNSELSLLDAWTASISGTSGPLGRPLAMLSFYLNYHLAGFSPLSFKLVNILVHALNTVIVFFIVSKLLSLLAIRTNFSSEIVDIRSTAFWSTIIWAVHPINLTAVLYVVQRMTSMAAMFTLLGIYCYITLREKIENNLSQFISKLILIILFGLVSALCKENGLLLFVFLLAIECFFFHWHVNTLSERQCLNIFYFIVIFLPSCLAIFMLLNGELTAKYSGRSFDLIERSLTQFRVIWFYIFQILLPQADIFGLHHDDFILSKSIVEPISTLWATASLVLLSFFAIRHRKKIPWLAFGLTFFFIGHLMESTILPLNLVHEHRNYLPSIGLIIIFVISLNLMVNKIKFINKHYFFAVITLLFTILTISRAHDWSDVILLGERLVQHHPNSVTSNYEMGYAYTKKYLQTKNPVFGTAAKVALRKAETLAINTTQPAIALIHLNAMLGEEEDQSIINKLVINLKNNKINNTEIVELRQLINCQVESKCNLTSTTIHSLFSSILENEKVTGRLSDDVRYIYSSYLVTIPNGASQGLAIMRDVVLRNPNTLEYQIKLISILLTNEKVNEANMLMKDLNKSHGIKFHTIKE